MLESRDGELVPYESSSKPSSPCFHPKPALSYILHSKDESSTSSQPFHEQLHVAFIQALVKKTDSFEYIVMEHLKVWNGVRQEQASHAIDALAPHCSTLPSLSLPLILPLSLYQPSYSRR